MSYSPKLGSAFNKTRLRDREHPAPCSGMCSVCGDCPGLCEIGLAAVRGADTVYPTAGGNFQYGSEKIYPVDYSHFNINGRVFGAMGAPEHSEEATVYHVKMETEIGREDPIKLKMPVILPAMAKLDWQDYFAGAAMAGVLCVIGEGAVDKDPGLVVENGKVANCQLLKDMIGAFRKYEHGYGDIILQCNCDDDLKGVAEYGITQCGATSIEFKFGQSAKGIQAMGIVGSLEEALQKKKNGALILPDPEEPAVQEEYKAGRGVPFRDYNRLPMWDEEYLVGRINSLRELGARNIFFKMAGYDPQDMEKVLRIACAAGVDMVTFDGAGGGSGNSPVKMMNEWCYPTVQMEMEVHSICCRLEKEGLDLPDIAITGGIASEDQVFKALAFGAPYVTVVGIGRAAMAAAMSAKKVGEMIAAGEVPEMYRKFGSTVPEIFADLRELRTVYGDEADSFPTGAIGVFSYLNKIHLGVRQFLALNRKFDVAFAGRDDLIPLTYEARDLLRGTYLK